MKTITLRNFLRDPRKVKRWTKAGLAVRITEKGSPLWITSPASTELDQARRRREWENDLMRMMEEPETEFPASHFVLQGRR